MLTSKLEVLVDFGPKPDQETVNNTLKTLRCTEGVTEVQYRDGAFMVETILPSSRILDIVSETSAKKTVLQGFGDAQSAVAMVSAPGQSGGVLGVVRFQQTARGPLVVDGTVDGLRPGEHGLHVHESGDLSRGCESIGGHYNPRGSVHGSREDAEDARHAGDLGNITADPSGRATFRIVDDVLKVWDIIGRSVAVTSNKDDLGKGNSARSTIDGNSGERIACGIIARSAGVFQNPKRVCACDGVVVWDERDRPLAGRGRSAAKPCCRNGTADGGDAVAAGGEKKCCKV